MIADVVIAVLVLVGTSLGALAGLGLHRFESIYARMHAATKPATMGLLFVLAAVAIGAGHTGTAAKLALVALLQFVSAPIASHAIARAAHLAGEPMGENAVVDELREHRMAIDDGGEG